MIIDPIPCMPNCRCVMSVNEKGQVMKPHIHAALMLQYAQDASETDEPWLRWQTRWGSQSDWRGMESSPTWLVQHEYRRKPRTININGHEVPEPMREALAQGATYFVARTDKLGALVAATEWGGDDYDKTWLARGLCHSTREAAEWHARALLSFMEVRS